MQIGETMTTRADFYVGEGPEADWLGSIAYDGYPAGLEDSRVLEATTEAEYRNAVSEFLVSRNDATMPDEGWPWPWDDSSISDYAYAWMDDKLWSSCTGSRWFLVQPELDCLGEPREPGDDFDDQDKARKVIRDYPSFPDMSSRKRVKLGGPGSGLIILDVAGS